MANFYERPILIIIISILIINARLPTVERRTAERPDDVAKKVWVVQNCTGAVSPVSHIDLPRPETGTAIAEVDAYLTV